MDLIHVFLGTKAQYIKTSPLIRLMDQRSVAYRLIDSGQHAALTRGLRTELGVREPDHVLGGAADITTVPQALRWSAGLASRLGNAKKLREEVFGGHGGICVVHGDTPSTFLSVLMARRAGLVTAHLEAGLRSRSLLHPFPEELIRLAVMRWSQVLFAPDDTAVANLHTLKIKGEIVPVGGNSVVEALRRALPDLPVPGSGPAVVTMHRVENLRNKARTDALVELVVEAARTQPVRFVVHGPTAETFARRGIDVVLANAGVDVVPLLPHQDFTRAIAAAPWVITDGGSVQEEGALLGVPMLLWRQRTERPDGLDANVVLSSFDPAVARAFLADPEAHRREVTDAGRTPSERVLDVLLEKLTA